MCPGPQGYLGTSGCFLFKQVSATAVREPGGEGAGKTGGRGFKVSCSLSPPLPPASSVLHLFLRFKVRNKYIVTDETVP